MLVTDRGVPAPEHYPLIVDQPDQQVNEIEPEPELSEVGVLIWANRSK